MPTTNVAWKQSRSYLWTRWRDHRADAQHRPKERSVAAPGRPAHAAGPAGGGCSGRVRQVRRAGFKPSLNLLYSLEGALADCHWQDVPEARRHALLAEYEAASALLPVRGRAVGGPVETVHYARADNDDTHGDADTTPDFDDVADADQARDD